MVPSSRGAKVGREFSRRKDPGARSPSQAQMGRGLLGKGNLGPAVGAVLMRTTCVRGAPRICDTRVIRGVVHHAAVVRVPRERLCRSQEDGRGPRGGTVRPPGGFRGGGVSMPTGHTGHTGPAPVPVRGSTQGVRAPRRRFQPIGRLESRPLCSIRRVLGLFLLILYHISRKTEAKLHSD